MRFFSLALAIVFAVNVNAQFTNPAMNNVNRTIPGTFIGYGTDPLRGVYTVYFDDGKHYSGLGSMKKDGDQQVLKVKDLYGNRRLQKAQGTARLIFEPDGTNMFSKKRNIYEFITVGNQYWMLSAGGTIPELYYALQQPGVAAIKKDNTIRLASLDDVLAIIGSHKQAEKFARKGAYDRAFAEFNGTSTSMYRSGKKGDPEKKEENK